MQNLKFIYNLSYTNNFTLYFNFYEEDYEDDLQEHLYNISFSKKSFFFRKTNYGVKNNIKLLSLKRNKNLSINNLIINS